MDGSPAPIRRSVSADGFHFKKDKSFSFTLSERYNRASARDPKVVKSVDGLFHMFVTTTDKKIGRGCLAHLVSDDGESWREVGNIYESPDGREPECSDYFEFGTSDVIIVDAYTASYDLRMMDIDSDGNPYFCINLEKFADAVKKLYELNHETTGVFPYVEISDNNEMTDLCNYFSQDHHVFINNWIYGTETAYLRNMQSDYGIIPYPKWDENQKTYLTFQHDQIGVFGIPITSTRVEAAAAVIEAMSSESALGLKPIYYDVALKGKYLRDETSAEMIEIIHNNRAFDPAWVYCLFIGDLAQTPRNLLLSGKSDFMSYYKKREKMYNRNLEKLIEAFSKIGQ